MKWTIIRNGVQMIYQYLGRTAKGRLSRRWPPIDPKLVRGDNEGKKRMKGLDGRQIRGAPFNYFPCPL